MFAGKDSPDWLNRFRAIFGLLLKKGKGQMACWVPICRNKLLPQLRAQTTPQPSFGYYCQCTE